LALKAGLARAIGATQLGQRDMESIARRQRQNEAEERRVA